MLKAPVIFACALAAALRQGGGYALRRPRDGRRTKADPAVPELLE
jgi:hypothetical protein